MANEATRGIRVSALRLLSHPGREEPYDVDLTIHGAPRPLSIIAGPSQTGKTSIIDFIRYCMGDDEHPQHPEIIWAVRSALLQVELNGETWTLERTVTGSPSKFSSTWPAPLNGLSGASEARLPIEPISEPTGLSQFLLAACDLENVALPEAPTQPETSTQLLSIRDLFKVMWLPNERLDNKNLVFEQSNFMVTQKLRQTIDVMFDVHDAAGTDLAGRLRAATQAATDARRAADSLREVVEDEYPAGRLPLEAELQVAITAALALEAEIDATDSQNATVTAEVAGLRRRLERTQRFAREAALRVRNRESLVERMTALRVQYADDKRKLTFLQEAEKVFDILHVSVCPACFSDLDSAPELIDDRCSLCGQDVAAVVQGRRDVDVDGSGERNSDSVAATSSGMLQAELRAVSRRLDELNDYWVRLDGDLGLLRGAQHDADLEAEAAAAAVDAVTTLPAPFLAARDDLARRRNDTLLVQQRARAGLRLWDRVDKAVATADRLAGQASRLRQERSVQNARPDRRMVVRKLSDRFGAVLAAIGYPKLSEPYLDDQLVPHVRGLPYTSASSGGLTLISLAWYLALWELSVEEGARAPGLLMIDSPQKNLGHRAQETDPEFADDQLVENFYAHLAGWLAHEGRGAQAIVVDNSPPTAVLSDVVVRYTRDRDTAPYGLIDDALD